MVLEFTVAYFLVTVTCAFITVILLLQLNMNMGSEQEVSAFRAYLIGFLVFDITNMVWIWINNGYLKISGSPWTMVNLLAITISSYYWFRYIEAKISEEFLNSTLFKFLSLVPLAIAIIMIVISPWTGLVYYYDASNQYQHGPAYSTMFILAISYLLFATIHLFIALRHPHSNDQARDYLVSSGFLVFPIFFGLVDIFIPNLPIMELALLFGSVLIYTNLQRSQIYNDSLTDLNNRRAANRYISNALPNINKDNPMYFYMFDIDHFKSINDTYGHLEGDKALRIVGKALQNYTQLYHHFVARWGGDEFCVIVTNENLSDPDIIPKNVQQLIDEEAKGYDLEYDLKLSCGYGKQIESYESPDEVIEEADKALYEHKRKIEK